MDRPHFPSSANLREGQRLIDLARAMLAESNVQIVMDYLDLASVALDIRLETGIIEGVTAPALGPD